MEVLISVKGLKISTKDKEILCLDDFSVNKGEIIFLNGGNGCGKSSLLNALFGMDNNSGVNLIMADDGHCFFKSDNYDIDLFKHGEEDDNIINNEISYLEQTDKFNKNKKFVFLMEAPTLAAIDNSGKQNQAKLRIKCHELAKEYLRLFIFDKRKKVDKYLSGGEGRMLSFFAIYLKAVVMNSSLLVLDEPLNYLSKENKKVVDQKLSDLIYERMEKGNPISIIIVSHCLIFKFIENDKLNIKNLVYNFENKTFQEREIQYHNCLYCYD